MSSLSIAELQTEYRSGKRTVTQTTEEFLSKTQADSNNSVLQVLSDHAIRHAQKLDQEKNFALPLYGVPIAVKDLLTLKNTRTTAGSRMLQNYLAPYTATCVQNLIDAGAVITAKLNMDEFAMGGSNENSAFGAVKNPVNPEYVPGGSSGGSAAAVRSGICLASLGSDTGGSIRLPASYCGVVGLKPTYGRVSRYGVVAFASSLDQVGPMAMTVQDASVVLRSLVGFDSRDSTSAQNAPLLSENFSNISLKGLRVGVLKATALEGVDAEQLVEIQKASEELKSQGAVIQEIKLPHARHSVAVYYLVAVSEASTNLSRMDGVRFGYRPKDLHARSLEEFYSSCREAFGPEVKRRILLGTFALSSGYYDAYYDRACRVRRLIRQDFEAAFSKVDVILSPVSPSGAFKLGTKISDPLKLYLNDLLTIPANLAGIPAISVPRALDRHQMPFGVQIQAPWFEENRLLRVGQFLERRL